LLYIFIERPVPVATLCPCVAPALSLLYNCVYYTDRMLHGHARMTVNMTDGNIRHTTLCWLKRQHRSKYARLVSSKLTSRTMFVTQTGGLQAEHRQPLNRQNNQPTANRNMTNSADNASPYIINNVRPSSTIVFVGVLTASAADIER